MAVTTQAVSNVVDHNLALSERILSRRGQDYVDALAASKAREVAAYLEGRDTSDYAKSRQDAALREIATSGITVSDSGDPSWRRRVGYVDLFDKNGVSVLHPNPKVEGRNFSEYAKDFPDMWKLVTESFSEPAVKGYYDFVDQRHQPKRKFMALRAVNGTPFIVAACVNIEDFFLPTHKLILEAGEKAKGDAREQIKACYANEINSFQLNILALALILAGFCALIGMWLAKSLSRPIQDLRAAVGQVAKGEFNVNAPIKGSDETRDLALAFNHLGQELTAYTENLKKETAARQAVQSEVTIARRIQNALLPKGETPFPERPEFGLSAKLLPAREVAGDFYDFFFVDDDTLALVIADVSGKGVPAAFFMAVSRTLLKTVCHHETNPAVILDKTNELLCRENDICMFVTLFMIFINPKTGAASFANAGHLEAVLIDHEGHIASFGHMGNLPLGVQSKHHYLFSDMLIDPGDTLFFYTDGIIEAINADMELYGEDRLWDVLKRNSQKSVGDLCDAVVADVRQYEGSDRSDDITVMAFRRSTR